MKYFKAVFSLMVIALPVLAAESDPLHRLKKINLEVDLATLASLDPFENKADVIERATYNLGRGSPAEIADRMKLITYAILESRNPELIFFTLRQSVQGEGVLELVPVVIRALESSRMRLVNADPFHNESQIMSAAVVAAVSRFFEALKHGRNNDLSDIRGVLETTNDFLSKDVKTYSSLVDTISNVLKNNPAPGCAGAVEQLENGS